MIEGMLNQAATWKRKTGQDEYGEPDTVDTDIRVRWEGKRRMVRNQQGQEVVSEARVYCKEAVQPGDIMTFGDREWPVIAVSETPDMGGQVLYREVAC